MCLLKVIFMCLFAFSTAKEMYNFNKRPKNVPRNATVMLSELYLTDVA